MRDLWENRLPKNGGKLRKTVSTAADYKSVALPVELRRQGVDMSAF
jgi:hypothetical protein